MTAQDYLDARSKHRLTVDEFLLLDREGAFGDRRTELFEGEVYYMSPKHRPHARAVTELVIGLATALEDSELSVLSDISVRLSEHDVPEPDIAITNAPEGDGILPLEAVKLLIEVSDSTLAQDLGLKAALYAGTGVPEVSTTRLSEGLNFALVRAFRLSTRVTDLKAVFRLAAAGPLGPTTTSLRPVDVISDRTSSRLAVTSSRSTGLAVKPKAPMARPSDA